jgi:hypothetical protein
VNWRGGGCEKEEGGGGVDKGGGDEGGEGSIAPECWYSMSWTTFS